MPFVRQYAATDRDWFDRQPWPSLRRWLDTQLSAALFEKAMLRIEPWRGMADPAVRPCDAQNTNS